MYPYIIPATLTARDPTVALGTRSECEIELHVALSDDQDMIDRVWCPLTPMLLVQLGWLAYDDLEWSITFGGVTEPLLLGLKNIDIWHGRLHFTTMTTVADAAINCAREAFAEYGAESAS